MPWRAVRQVEGEVSEYSPLPAGGLGVEVGDAEDDAVVGERGPNGRDRELGAPDDPVDAAFAVTLPGGVLPDLPHLPGGLVDPFGSRVRRGLEKTLPSRPTTWSRL